LISPDEDFSKVGAKTGIGYPESFHAYKKMLTDDPEDDMYKRIYSIFNASLFGIAPTVNDNLVVDNSNYDSEIEEFKQRLRATDSPAEDVTDTGVDEVSGPSPSRPMPPPQPDHRVSILVASNVSHTVTTSSQVSHVVNSSVSIPPEHGVIEDSPPSPQDPPSSPPPPALKAVRPVARKKGGKSKTTASNTNADTAPAPNDQTTRQVKAVPAVTRALRKRT